MTRAPNDVGMQTAINCSLCDKTAEQVCTTCRYKLCSSCKDNHSTSKSHKHNVVRLTLSTLSISKESSSQLCDLHAGYTANVCCQECEIPVCEQCLLGDHNGHKIVDTEKMFKEKQGRFGKTYNSAIRNLPLFRNKLSRLEEWEKEAARNKEREKQKLCTHIEKAKSKLDSVKNLLMEKLDEDTSEQLYILNTQKEAIHRDIKNMDDFVSYYGTITPQQKIDFILLADDMTRSLPENLPHLPFPRFFQFVEGYFDERIMQQITGSLVASPEDYDEVLCENAKLMETISLDVKNMISLSYQLSDDSFWVIAECSEDLLQFNKKGSLLNRIDTNTVKRKNRPVCCIRDGISIFRKDVYSLNCLGEGKEKLFFYFPSAIPISVCCTHKNEILVATINVKKNEGKIFRYNKESECVQELENSDISSTFFRKERERTYIAENRNGDICISNGIVDVFSFDGQHSFTYNGQPKCINFRSQGICTDNLEHILVADEKSRTVHILQSSGDLLKLLRIPGINTSRPLLVTIDRANCLCVGCSDETIRVLHYLKSTEEIF